MDAEARSIGVGVVYALPERAWTVKLELPDGATVGDAVARSGLECLLAERDMTQISFAIFGQPASERTLLRDGDRVELLRPLQADPKAARRRRAKGED